jgi:hypothetical protein
MPYRFKRDVEFHGCHALAHAVDEGKVVAKVLKRSIAANYSIERTGRMPKI